MMRTMTIERALNWAYGEELPKATRGGSIAAIGSPMGWVKDVGDLGAFIDVNRYGVVPIIGFEAEEPHPDALVIAEAVEQLEGVEVEPFALEDLVADMAHLGPAVLEVAARARDLACHVDAEGHWRLRLSLPVVLRRCTVLGDAPKVGVAAPKLVDVCGANGKPVWRRRVRRAVRFDAATGDAIAWSEVEIDARVVDGRVPRDAYRVQEIRPDPCKVLVERLTYAAWIAGMDALVEALDGRLATIRVLGHGRARVPWAGDTDAAAGRVLVDLARAARERVDEEGRREVLRARWQETQRRRVERKAAEIGGNRA